MVELIAFILIMLSFLVVERQLADIKKALKRIEGVKEAEKEKING